MQNWKKNKKSQTWNIKMHALSNQLNKCLDSKGIAHIHISLRNECKTHITWARKPFPETKIWELFTFSYGTSAFIKGTNTDQPNSFALWASLGAYANVFLASFCSSEILTLSFLWWENIYYLNIELTAANFIYKELIQFTSIWMMFYSGKGPLRYEKWNFLHSIHPVYAIFWRKRRKEKKK